MRIRRDLTLDSAYPGTGYRVRDLCRVKFLPLTEVFEPGMIFATRGYHQAKHMLLSVTLLESGVKRDHWGDDPSWDRYECVVRHLGEFYADNRFQISKRPRRDSARELFVPIGTPPCGYLGSLRPCLPVGRTKPAAIPTLYSYETGLAKGHDMTGVPHGPPRPPKPITISSDVTPIVNDSGCLAGWKWKSGGVYMLKLPVPKWSQPDPKPPVPLKEPLYGKSLPEVSLSPDAVLASFRLKGPPPLDLGQAFADSLDALCDPDDGHDQALLEGEERDSLVASLATYLGCTTEQAGAMLGKLERKE